MISRGGGSIINMSSVASHIRGIDRRCAYGAAKAAVVGLTKGLAREHVQQGIRQFDVILSFKDCRRRLQLTDVFCSDFV